MGTLSGIDGAVDSIEIPAMQTTISNSSGNVANANAVATLPAVPGLVNYLTGFQAAASGATAGLAVNLTVTGVKGGTITLPFTFPAGILVGAYPLTVNFFPALQATGPNVAIVVTLPAGGANNAHAGVSAQGFTLGQ